MVIKHIHNIRRESHNNYKQLKKRIFIKGWNFLKCASSFKENYNYSRSHINIPLTVLQIENEGTLYNEFYKSRVTLNPKLNASYHDKYQDKICQ